MRLCIQCNKNPVQGCRCYVGANYCKVCNEAHPGPHKTFREIIDEYAKESASKIYDKISEDIIARFGETGKTR